MLLNGFSDEKFGTKICTQCLELEWNKILIEYKYTIFKVVRRKIVIKKQEQSRNIAAAQQPGKIWSSSSL